MTRRELPERVIVGVFAIIILAIVLTVVLGGRLAVAPERAARRYLQGLYGVAGDAVQCQRWDSDSNGYVSCEARVGPRRVVALECPVLLSINTGCRTRSLTGGLSP